MPPHLAIEDELGRRIVLIDKEVLSLGRSADADVRLSDAYTSRHHAEIVTNGDACVLIDRDSRYGTFVNGEQITEHVLTNGDRIVLGQHCTLIFVTNGNIYRSPGSNASDAVTVVQGLPKSERYQAIAALLARYSVHCPDIDSVALHKELQDPNSNAARWLGQGFHRIVELDALQGCRADGAFDMSKFSRHIVRCMSDSFGSTLPDDEFHFEDILQILKDEPRSLFCFLNVTLVPTDHLHLLRGFTQERHAVLLCGPHDLD